MYVDIYGNNARIIFSSFRTISVWKHLAVFSVKERKPCEVSTKCSVRIKISDFSSYFFFSLLFTLKILITDEFPRSNEKSLAKNRYTFSALNVIRIIRAAHTHTSAHHSAKTRTFDRLSNRRESLEKKLH